MADPTPARWIVTDRRGLLWGPHTNGTYMDVWGTGAGIGDDPAQAYDALVCAVEDAARWDAARTLASHLRNCQPREYDDVLQDLLALLTEATNG